MEFKEELEAKGYKFKSETDTETVVHLIDSYYNEGMDLLDAVSRFLTELKVLMPLVLFVRIFLTHLLQQERIVHLL